MVSLNPLRIWANENKRSARLSFFVGAIVNLVKATLGSKEMDKNLVSISCKKSSEEVKSIGAIFLKSVIVENSLVKILVQDD